MSSPALGLSPAEINAIVNDPSSSGSLLSSSSAAHRVDVSATVLAAYQRGFRIVFLLGAALAALSFLLAALLMPQIEIKHEEKVKEDGERS
jgi:predicted MFS family arabinose efflux permease